MDISVAKKLCIEKEDENFELEIMDHVIIWLINGDCMAAQIDKIHDDYITVIDEEGDKQVITFVQITDIKEN